MRIMKIRIKNAVKLFIDDLRQYGVLIITIFAVWVLATAVFHNFCQIVLLTGFPCPGCGITRAAISMLLLHPVQAFRYNPSICLWIPFVIVIAWKRYFQIGRIRGLNWILSLVAIGTILIYIWRLLHEFPGESPMNYEPNNLFALIHPEYSEFVKAMIHKK